MKMLPQPKDLLVMGDTHSDGRSSIVYSMLAKHLEKGGTVVYMDTEASFDPEFARKVGLNIDYGPMSSPSQKGFMIGSVRLD